MRTAELGAVIATAMMLAGCAIDTSVSPVAARPDAVCLVQNDQVLMDGFHAELARQIEARGIHVTSVDGANLDDCRYRVSYTANWKWDMAMYLSYAQIDVLNGPEPVGRAIYDATNGSFNMDKFGPTAGKIAPLVTQLFG